MNKILRTILIISIAIFGAVFLFVPSTKAIGVDELIVKYWTGTEWKLLEGSIFNEANFLPGQSVTRLVMVTNYSGQTQRIAAEAINKSDPNRLGDVLNLEIKEGGTRLYNNALSKFFTEGEVYLSNLAGNEAQTQYDFIITFYSGTGNPFQGKSLNFDILVGFQGEEGGILPGAGGGGGGYLPPGLTITDEAAEEIGTTEVTITWLTSYFSTSQVIYDTISGQFDLSAGPSNYGYAFSKEGDDVFDLGKGKMHQVTLTDLVENTTYYYRCVSHASLAISTEHSFTTLVVEEAGEEEGVVVIEGETEEGVGGQEEEAAQISEVGGFEGPELVEVGLEEPTGFGKFLAAIGAFPFNLKVILVIVALILIVLIILWLFKKKRKREE